MNLKKIINNILYSHIKLKSKRLTLIWSYNENSSLKATIIETETKQFCRKSKFRKFITVNNPEMKNKTWKTYTYRKPVNKYLNNQLNNLYNNDGEYKSEVVL